MNYNIINGYIEFVKSSFLNFFKIVLGDRYRKTMILPFIEKYIDVRYYNETNYLTVKDFINRLNKELVDLTEMLATDENIEDIKDAVALFGYLVYFDEVCVVEQDAELIKVLTEDELLKINDKEKTRKEILTWYKAFRDSKDRFNKTLTNKDFTLLEKRLYKKLHYLSLEHNIKISNLYSEYAIEKAYTTGTIAEDKLFITYILASALVLDNAINLDFSRYYMVPMASSLFDKDKKFTRLLKIFDNQLCKKFLSIWITYSDYKKNKRKIDDLISEGYTFGIELDSSYTGITSDLVLFPYIFVYEDNPEFEMLDRDKDKLKSKIVKL